MEIIVNYNIVYANTHSIKCIVEILNCWIYKYVNIKETDTY